MSADDCIDPHTVDPPESRTNAGASPRGRVGPLRHKPLNTVEDMRAQMARVYWRLEDGELNEDQAKSRTYILGKMVECLKVTESNLDSRLDALLKRAEGRLG